MSSRKLLLIAAGLAITVFGNTVVASRPHAAEDEYLGLPDAPGREEVFAYCGACHSVKLVVQQGQTRQGWSKLLTWMNEEQGMPKLEPEEKKLVLDYLAEYLDPASQKERLRERGVIR